MESSLDLALYKCRLCSLKLSLPLSVSIHSALCVSPCICPFCPMSLSMYLFVLLNAYLFLYLSILLNVSLPVYVRSVQCISPCICPFC